MNNDIKAINEVYKQGIDHTERNEDSYSYKVVDYANLRNEQEEDSAAKKQVISELSNLIKRAQRGTTEDYKYILLAIETLKKNISNLL